jgi:SAM-dependent methyltransferase
MSRTNYKEEIIQFYTPFLLYTDINKPEAVAWDSTEAQTDRFKVLYDIGITEDDSILDLGCGLGHFVNYLNNINHPTTKYSGVDINPHYIFYAIQKHPDISFKTGEIFDLSDSFDYIIGSGMFTVKMPKNEILGAIDYAYNLANKGVAFNFLTNAFNDGEDSVFNTFDPNEFYEEFKIRYGSDNTVLVTNYHNDEDFTIYIYK